MSAITKRDIKMCSKEEEGSAEMRRGPWTLEEDSLLIHYIARHGEGRWNMLAKSAGLKRNGKSCRLRWLNYLKPDIKRGNLTPQEQLLILDLHSRWGNRWSKIAQHLPGRTDNEIKNYWRTRVQKQARQLNIESGSKKFIDAIRCFWMPRLVQKSEQKQNSPSTTSYSSLTDTNLHVSSSALSSPMLSTNNNSVIPYSLSCSTSSTSSFQEATANFPSSFCSNNPSNFASADSWQFSQQQILEPSSSELAASPSCYMLENNNNACYSNPIQENLLVMNNIMATTSSGYGMDNNNLMNLQQEPATTTMMETYDDMLPFDYYHYHQPTIAESDWTTLGNMADTLWNMEAL